LTNISCPHISYTLTYICRNTSTTIETSRITNC